MSAPGPRAATRRGILAGVVIALTASAGAVPAGADPTVTPKSRTITILGAGWGHGLGMSQYGAYGAASKGMGHTSILKFYYAGTTLARLAAGNALRVLISADNDNGLHFRPASGQRVSDSAGASLMLPSGSKYTKWRISRSGNKRVLSYRNPAGAYVAYRTKLKATRVWSVHNAKTGTVKLAMPNGTTRSYRGKLSLRFAGSGARIINTVSMENYLRGVVPAEMPASWPAEALKAQSVAARTYAAKLRSTVRKTATYDLCDTSACQVYRGVSVEYRTTDAAIKSTANKVVKYKGALALTMFSSSNGGWAASGGSGYPYLKAHKDPYDGLKRDQSWSVSLSASKIVSAYPGIGALTSVRITARDGDGTYGGRVQTIRITGTKGSVNASGGSFKSRFGLKERLFKLVGATVSGSSRSATVGASTADR